MHGHVLQRLDEGDPDAGAVGGRQDVEDAGDLVGGHLHIRRYGHLQVGVRVRVTELGSFRAQSVYTIGQILAGGSCACITPPPEPYRP